MSGGVGRRSGLPRLMFVLLGLLRTLRAVLRAALLAIGNAGRIQRAPDDVIPDTRQVFNTAAAHKHNGVLLQLMTLTRDIGRHLDAVGQAYARDLAQRRIRLLRR